MRIVSIEDVSGDVVLFSRMISNYGLVAEIVLVEKGAVFEVVDVDPNSAEHRQRHPFGKIPVLDDRRSGVNARICESVAIACYVDDAFEGPPLQPADRVLRARMIQWIQIVNAYLFPTINGGIIKPRLVPSSDPPDEAAIAAAVADAGRQLDLVETAIASTGSWLASESWTLADAFLYPILGGLLLTPEGSSLFANLHNCRAWLSAMQARESVRTTGWAAR